MVFIQLITLSILIMLVGALAPIGIFYLFPTVFNNLFGFIAIMILAIGLIVYGVLLYTLTFQTLFKKLGWTTDGQDQFRG